MWKVFFSIGGALLGAYLFNSLIGGFIGYFVGEWIAERLNLDDSDAAQRMRQHYYGDYDGDNRSSSGGNAFGRQNFIEHLLVLAAYIIRADGKIMHSEMETVRGVFRQNFGDAMAAEADRKLKNLFAEAKQMRPEEYDGMTRLTCQRIAQSSDYSGRLQLLSFLVIIAQADGSVPQVELKALRDVAAWLQMDPGEVDSMLHLGGESVDDAYKVLGIEPTATDEEVRKAYRKLALQHHPDRVANLGDDVKKAAERKFQEINNAKERIYKARGLA